MIIAFLELVQSLFTCFNVFQVRVGECVAKIRSKLQRNYKESSKEERKTNKQLAYNS
jgi:hypothetical protein